MATYCVVLRSPAFGRAVRFYLKADSAETAIATAARENPTLRALGIEVSDGRLCAQKPPRAA